MKKNLLFFLFACCSIGLYGCSKSTVSINVEDYKKEIDQWHATRVQRLTSENGWLTLVGLFWLKEGENTFGTDSSNTIIFPMGKTPAVAGSLWLDHGAIRMTAKPGTQIKIKDSIVTSALIQDDGEGTTDPTILNIGTISFYAIKRAGQLGVRVKDSESPVRKDFKGLDYFPTDVRYRFEARFEPYTPPRIIKIASMINTVEDDSCPGAIVFTLDGKEYRLDAVKEVGSDNELFMMFSDETSGKETYGMGRQLYTSLPDKDNNVVLDFNKAYNWPCVFTTFATCPIPPRQNHLPFRVEAGEKMYSGHK
jgi:uncharacterized protein (DUF1684 family)